MDDQDDWEDMFCFIKDILPDDEVLSLDEASQRLVYARINKKMDMGIQDVYEIETKSGRKIRVTANHPFLVQKGGII
jgi:intein/homing endonuclease